MALKKTTYVSGSTIITAENLNDIQDSVIALENTEKQVFQAEQLLVVLMRLLPKRF